MRSSFDLFLKRTLDIVASAIGLLVLLPLLAVLYLAVRLTSPGPAIYRGVRIGRGGRPFHLLKFRSMIVNAEAVGGSATANNDARLTETGKLLRKYKLDELPQLFNVLAGDMSLVGPRPEVKKFVDMYTPEEKLILSVRPGITDWASVWNIDEGGLLAPFADPEEAYRIHIRPTKLRLQLYYVRHRTIGMDLRILVATLARLFIRTWTPREIDFLLKEPGRP